VATKSKVKQTNSKRFVVKRFYSTGLSLVEDGRKDIDFCPGCDLASGVIFLHMFENASEPFYFKREELLSEETKFLEPRPYFIDFCPSKKGCHILD
jgi:hypothetical protein